MKSVFSAILLALVSSSALAASPVLCKCEKFTGNSTTYYFLKVLYKDKTGAPRDLMMGAYGTEEVCKSQAKKLVEANRCQF